MSSNNNYWNYRIYDMEVEFKRSKIDTILEELKFVIMVLGLEEREQLVLHLQRALLAAEMMNQENERDVL